MCEGDRSFARAFEERFVVRDMAMVADHSNFMCFDINNEADALSKIEAFAKYVLSPLNPVLRQRLETIESQKLSQPASSHEESKGAEDDQVADMSGHHSGSGSYHDSFTGMSSL